jgi:hypothetical protein
MLPLQSSHSGHSNAGSDNHVITFASDTRLDLVGTGKRGLEGNITAGREGEASSDVIPTIHGTSFCALNIVCDIFINEIKITNKYG